MQLKIRRVKTTPSTKLSIEKSLESKPARYPITQTTVKPVYIEAGKKNCTFEDIFAGKTIPKFAAFTLVTQTAFRGTYNQQPFSFKHQDLVSLKLSFGSDSYPSPEFRPLYTSTNEEDWTREYYALMMQTFKSDSANFITYELFKSHYAIYVIELGQFSLTSNDHVTPKRNMTARLDIDFLQSRANQPALVGLLYAEWDSEIQITSARNVLRDYILYAWMPTRSPKFA